TNCLDFDLSAAGRFFATGWKDGSIHVHHTKEGSEVFRLETGLRDSFSFTFSLEGSHIAAGGAGSEITLWDTSGKETLRLPRSGTANVRSLALAPGGKRLAAVDSKGDIELRNL